MTLGVCLRLLYTTEHSYFHFYGCMLCFRGEVSIRVFEFVSEHRTWYVCVWLFYFVLFTIPLHSVNITFIDASPASRVLHSSSSPILAAYHLQLIPSLLPTHASLLEGEFPKNLPGTTCGKFSVHPAGVEKLREA